MGATPARNPRAITISFLIEMATSGMKPARRQLRETLEVLGVSPVLEVDDGQTTIDVVRQCQRWDGLCQSALSIRAHPAHRTCNKL